ncbi:MAG: MarR family winged helix-turn-helix transcriptional regulator [Nocardioides sp.]
MSLARRGPLLLLFAVNQQLGGLLRDAMRDAPLTPDEFAVTSALRLLGQVRAGELARTLGMRPTTLSNYLKRLEAGGRLTRSADPEDARAVLIELTERGLAETEACFPAFASALEAFEKGLAEEGSDVGEVQAVLESVGRALERARRRARP